MFRFPASVVLENAVETLAQAAADPAGTQFDLSGVGRFDSSLLAVLLELSRRAAGAGRRCEFRQAPPNLRKLANLYGVDELLFGGQPA